MSTDQVSSPARPATGPAAGRSLALLLVGAFMALLDTTIVNVALPSVQEGLGAGSSALEWVVSGYMLTLGLALIQRRDGARRPGAGVRAAAPAPAGVGLTRAW